MLDDFSVLGKPSTKIAKSDAYIYLLSTIILILLTYFLHSTTDMANMMVQIIFKKLYSY